MPRPPLQGFTLVELLVVVAIIVVLMALLAPALDKAIYEAQLTVCSAHQKTIGMSALNYAMESKRRYPDQPACDVADSYWQAVSLYYHIGPATTEARDQRPLLRPYMDINKLFNDPLVAPVVLDNTWDEATGNPNDATVDVIATMGLWAGYRYLGWKGMLKVGDRLEHRGYVGGVVKNYEIMVSDRDVPGNPIGQPKLENDAVGWARQGTLKLAGSKGGGKQSSHPDDKDLLTNVPIQDGQHPWGGVNIGLTISYWLNLDSWAERGKIDSNYTFQDLSVIRYRGVTGNDDRMADVYTFSHKAGGAQQFPK